MRAPFLVLENLSAYVELEVVLLMMMPAHAGHFLPFWKVLMKHMEGVAGKIVCYEYLLM